MKKQNTSVIKIISGGQTGADRGGLEAGQALGIETGGTAPKDYRTENGSDFSLKDFGLVEDSSTFYQSRTKKNILNSDATILYGDCTSKGSVLTIRLAEGLGKPILINPLSVQETKSWIKENNVKVLNVAGNRESKNPGICTLVKNNLIKVLR